MEPRIEGVGHVALLQLGLSKTIVGHDVGVPDILDDPYVSPNLASIVSALNTTDSSGGQLTGNHFI